MPRAYVDRRGPLYVGQEMVLRLAEAFCITESHRVLMQGDRELEVLQ